MIYWFDSHSQDEHSLSVVCGTSVLLKFRNLSEVEKYIHIAYLEYRDIQRLYFQIQFLRVNLSSAEISNTYSQYRFSIRRSNYQKNASVVNRKRRERYTTHTIGTEKHEKIKKKKKGLTHVEIIRIYSLQVIRISVKVKLSVNRSTFNFQTISLKDLIVCVFYAIVACTEG